MIKNNLGYKMTDEVIPNSDSYVDTQRHHVFDYNRGSLRILTKAFGGRCHLVMTGNTSEGSIYVYNEDTKGQIDIMIVHNKIRIDINPQADPEIIKRLIDKIYEVTKTYSSIFKLMQKSSVLYR